MWLSSLRIWRCHCCGKGLNPDPRTYACHGQVQPKKREKGIKKKIYIYIHIKSLFQVEKSDLLFEQDVECDTIYFERQKRKKVLYILMRKGLEGNQIYKYINFFIFKKYVLKILEFPSWCSSNESN